MDGLAKIPAFSGSTLKIIAIISMVIDHCAYFLMDENTMMNEAMRCIGRIAFPVFAFLIAEGFSHTRNRVQYFLSLLGFAVISEVPWFLLNGADGTHNVMFTLASGVMALAMLERMKENSILGMGAILLIAYFATWLGLDYEWRGIMLIVIYYIMREKKPLLVLFSLPLMIHYGIIGAILASAIVLQYDGQRGFIKGKAWKYGFYAFYPIHLYLIYLLV